MLVALDEVEAFISQVCF